MRRWFILAIMPTVLMIGHLGVTRAAVSMHGNMDTLVYLGLAAVEVVGLTTLSVFLGRLWPAPQHAIWSLPVGIAGGLAMWLLLPVTKPASPFASIIALGIWVFSILTMGIIVKALIARSRAAGSVAGAMGGVALYLLIPFAAVRIQLGADEAPWSTAAFWAASSTIDEALGHGLTQIRLVQHATLITAMVVLGTTIYLGYVLGGRGSRPVVTSDDPEEHVVTSTP